MIDLAAGTPHLMEETFTPGLSFVAMKVKDATAGLPGTLVATVAAVESHPGTYAAAFTPLLGKRYVAQMAAYTDGTYATYDDDHAPGSLSFNGVDASGGGGGSTPESDLVGVLESDDALIGVLEDCT